MPDHMHLFVRGRNLDLSCWIRSLKRTLSGVIPANPAHWQEGFFDHLVRQDESYARQWEYVRYNPVRARLVKQAEDWPYQGEIAIIDRA